MRCVPGVGTHDSAGTPSTVHFTPSAGSADSGGRCDLASRCGSSKNLLPSTGYVIATGAFASGASHVGGCGRPAYFAHARTFGGYTIAGRPHTIRCQSQVSSGTRPAMNTSRL